MLQLSLVQRNKFFKKNSSFLGLYLGPILGDELHHTLGSHTVNTSHNTLC